MNSVAFAYTPTPAKTPENSTSRSSSSGTVRGIHLSSTATPLPPTTTAVTTTTSFTSLSASLSSSSSSTRTITDCAKDSTANASQRRANEVDQSIRSNFSNNNSINNQQGPPQIRYCYFISAASAADSVSRNPSLHRKSVYLTPQTQLDMFSSSPNCTQPRSTRSTDNNTTTTTTATTLTQSTATASSSVFLLGPHPPQIQLQFLENEPLPPPSSTYLSNTQQSTADETEERIISGRESSENAVMVERKDSGYGGSVSRSSSLAAFGRGIRKVFWKTSAKGSVESVVVTDTPVLDYGIPQDVLDHIDHETWAQDLAQRLTQASGPDAVTAWLGQLSAEGTEEGDLAVVEEVGNNNTTRSNNIGGVVIGTAVMSTPEGADSSETVLDVVEEVIFTMPMPILPTPPPSIQSAPDSTTVLVSKPLPAIRAATVPNPAADPAAKTLRQVLSIEQLNKPQPSIPVSPQIPISKPAVNQVSRSSASSTSPFNSITRRLTPDFGFRKNSGSRQTDQPHSEAANDSTTSLMTSPDEVEGSSYLSINPTSKRSNRFFKSLTSSTASDLKTATRHENEVRPLSEVLLSNSNLSPEEITAEIVTASRSSSLRSPPMRRAAFPVWSQQPSPEVSAVSTLGPSPLNQETQQQQELSPPAPLFYNKIRSSVSASSLGETSSCGSIDSADDWDNSLTQNMVNHSQAQNARYSADLKDLQALLFQTGDRAAAGSRPHSIMTHSTNTSTGSLILPGSVSVSATVSTSTSNRKDSTIAAIAAAAAMKTLSKKDDYMSHRLSGVVSPKLLPTTGAGKSKPRKSRLSMTFGGGELEVVKSAKFDTPEAIARNKEIRKFISQEIFTTEQNYLQYLHTVQEVFVDPLFKSLQTAKPFIPKSNALYHLLSHISGLIAVSAQLTQALEDCVRDEVWSEDSTLIGTIFLNVKEPLSIFLKYGQAYGKGMKALRTLLKAKRASVATMPQSPSPFFVPAITTTASNSSSVSSSNHLTVPGPRLTKRRSLPSIFSLNPSSAPSSSSMMAFAAASATSSNAGSHHHSRRLSTTSTNSTYSVSKPSSTHGSARVSTMPLQRTLSEFELFVQNCHGGKETTSRFSLADLLILPIQRVTRYCLLLKDLKRHTNSDHDDYVGLVHALEQLHTLAMATNNVQPASMRL